MVFVKRIRNSLIGSGLASCLLVFYSLGLLTHHISRDISRESQSLKRKVFPSLGKEVTPPIIPRVLVSGSDDRIESQLLYQPNSRKIKTILLLDEHKMWTVPSGKSLFTSKACLVDSCR